MSNNGEGELLADGQSSGEMSSGKSSISSSEIDFEVAAAMADGKERKKKRHRSPAETPRPCPPGIKLGEKIVARCDLDGYYYSGRVVGGSAKPNRVEIEFDEAPLKSADVILKHVTLTAGAVSRPFIRNGDSVLVAVKNGLTGLSAYIPGIVIVTALIDGPRSYSILAYNRRTVTAFRHQILRISEAQFSATVGYIAERAKMMGVRTLAPLNRRSHFAIANLPKKIKKKRRRSPKRSAPRRLSPIVGASSQDTPSKTTSSNLSSRMATPTLPFVEELPKPELINRALSPINLLSSSTTDMKIEDVKQETSSSSSSSSSDEQDPEIVRPERRRRRFTKTLNTLDGTFKINETVVARSDDDGWYYKWKVESDIGNGAYFLRSRSDVEDNELVWKEHIFSLPGSRKRSTSSSSDEEGEDEEMKETQEPIDEGDYVIAKRPDFQHTYCAATVELIDKFNHEFIVKFCDNAKGRVSVHGGCFKISEKVFSEAVIYMKHCEDRWIGEKVVVLNPPKSDGGFEPVQASFVIGTVREHDKSSSGSLSKQVYVVELSRKLIEAYVPEDERDDDDVFAIRQSIDHIFGRFTKSRKLQVGDFVLGPTDKLKGAAGCLVYLPGVVKAIKKNQRQLTIKLINGQIIESLSARDVFWLRKEYFEAAEGLYKAHHLPAALKSVGTATSSDSLANSSHHSQEAVAVINPRRPSLFGPMAPLIVIQDIDKETTLKPTPPTVNTVKPPNTVNHRQVQKEPERAGEMIERCRNELEIGSGPDQVMRWIRDGSVVPSERLGNMAVSYHSILARAIYLRSNVPSEKSLDGIDSKEKERELLKSMLIFDPPSAVTLATILNRQPGSLDIEEIAEIMSNDEANYRYCVDFLMDAIDNDDKSATAVENLLLDTSAALGREKLNLALTCGKFTKYDKQKAKALSKKLKLWERYLEQLQFVDDIKAILGEHAFEVDFDWLVRFFEDSGFNPEDIYECIEEMLLSNKSGSDNIPAVVRLIKRFHRKLDVNNIVDLLERLEMNNALFAVLQTVLASSRNPILQTKFIQVACMVDKIHEAEQIVGDPNAVYSADQVWEFLVNLKKPKTGRLMALISDRFNMVPQLAKFCHENSQFRLLEAFVSRINPGRLEEVCSALKELGADVAVIDRIRACVASPPPTSRSSASEYVE